MSTVALVIKWDVSGSQFSESFYDYEILSAPLSPDDDDLLKELNNNKPIRIARNALRQINITFLLQSTNQTAISTLSKLKNIDNVSDMLYIYYKYIADNTAYVKCVMPKGQIPDEIVAAGMDSGRNEITVSFLQLET